MQMDGHGQEKKHETILKCCCANRLRSARLKRKTKRRLKDILVFVEALKILEQKLRIL